MDPIAAVGFASAILTFATVACQIIKETREIRGIDDGDHAAKVKAEFGDAYKPLVLGLQSNVPYPKELSLLADEGQKIHDEIQKKLETWLQASRQGKTVRSFQSLKLVLQGDSKKMKNLLERADQYRQEILLRLSVIIQYVPRIRYLC